MSDSFDASEFLGATLTEANSRRPPLPAGSEFPATIGDVEINTQPGKKDPTKTYTIVSFQLVLDITAGGQALVDSQGTPTVSIDGQIFLDTKPNPADPSKFVIDMSPGKNNALRRWREALNMNKPGDAFSFLAMTGRQVKVKVKNEIYQGETYDRFDSVSRL